MIRIALITAGAFAVLFHHYVMAFSMHWQQVFFLSGIALLGIPHGAADLLVAAQSAIHKQQHFSGIKFLANYIARLVIFGLVLWLFPVAGIVIFIFFAAYHFGETDLFFLRTDYWPGKLLVLGYGLVILSVILFHNSAELREFLHRSGSAWGERLLADWVQPYGQVLLYFSLIFFFSSFFLYFLLVKNTQQLPDAFLLQFASLVLILYYLPLVAGFTFYFVVWHAVLSLRNIVIYLKTGGKTPGLTIIKQIAFYSGLAMGGIIISGAAGSMLLPYRQDAMIYVFAGLAVLTAPHMQVMHHMYGQFRKRKRKAGLL